ncbi:hypothetical protein SPBR_03761 [Sporothrix brasiliensis 5110]|uniref:F-box domain-containing protein n=1 Tax=Sporothrix brasiliensis 5110 TaxID=1398154 RepID=A0A0C2J0L0_9PEZI|nr:uncharacterized protein SPBR_03761 [Sporothrix brasiliensis 5110]KIH94921.1 hypothetical protein SPBR_03761 [Sporothrix brasiliensis 5110]
MSSESTDLRRPENTAEMQNQNESRESEPEVDTSTAIYRPMRPPVNHILDLPVDVFFTLKEFLRGQDIILLSLTCKDLRHLMIQRPDQILSLALDIVPSRLEKYHMLVARDYYTHWVCHACTRLHTVFEMDLPGCPVHITWRRACHRAHCHTPAVAGHFSTVGAAGLVFHHIQIALRYQRLIKAGAPDTLPMRRAVPDNIRLVHQDATLSPVRVLHRIMDPIFKTMSRGIGDCDYALRMRFDRRIKEDHTAARPFTNLPQLRFVQRSRIKIVRHFSTVNCMQWDGTIFNICPHLTIMSQHLFSAGPVPPHSGYRNDPRNLKTNRKNYYRRAHYALYTTDQGLLRIEPFVQYHTIFDEEKGACAQCLTDYKVRGKRP